MANIRFIPENFLLPDIASLPAGLFNTPMKLSWRQQMALEGGPIDKLAL